MVFYSNGIFYQELSVLHKLYVFWPLSKLVQTLHHVFALSCDTLLTLVQCSICSLSSFLVRSSVSQSLLILLSWLAKLSFINRNCSLENQTCSHDRKFYCSETFRDYPTDCHRLAPFLVLSRSSTATVCCYIMSFDGFTEGDTGLTVGQAISEHLVIENVTFMGSTLTACKIFGASAGSNLKVVTLMLGGKPHHHLWRRRHWWHGHWWGGEGGFPWNLVSVMNISIDGLTTRSLTQANQCCTAGSRICIQEGIYDKFPRK